MSEDVKEVRIKTFYPSLWGVDHTANYAYLDSRQTHLRERLSTKRKRKRQRPERVIDPR